MSKQDSINYYRIAEAISYLQQNFTEQPDLNKLAEKINLSPFHFQKLFSDWAGISPKKFLHYLSFNYSKSVLKNTDTTLFDAALKTGLSGSGRLHDLFVTIEGMSPGDYKNGAADLLISYSFVETLFGQVLVASTSKGICKLLFYEEEQEAIKDLKATFPAAIFEERLTAMQQEVLGIFKSDWSDLKKIKLHLKGTAFQIKVWEALLKIPEGKLQSYGKLAESIGMAGASRAVGTAIGANPIAYLIPCHRVIQANGQYGNYRWGALRKKIMIGREASIIDWNSTANEHE